MTLRGFSCFDGSTLGDYWGRARTLAWLLVALVAGLTIGCGSSSSTDSSTGASDDVCKGAMAGANGPGAFDPDYRTSKQFFSQMSGLNEKGTSIHGATQIFYSCNLHGLLDDTTLEVPEGTVAIKAQDQNHDGKVDALRVMIKHAKGFDSAHGDFDYEVRSASGVQSGGDGSASFCFGCHQGYDGTGYLAGTSIK